MSKRVTALLLPLLVLALLVVGVPVAASGCALFQEELLGPWPAGAPPGEQRSMLASTQVVFVIDGPPVDGSYWFSAVLSAQACRGDVCLEFPKMAAAWYDADDRLIDSNEGDIDGVAGAVPDGSAYGLVFYRTTPYLATYPPTVPLDVSGRVCAP